MNAHTVKFFYNGIKVDGGKLIKGWFCHQEEFTTVGGHNIPEHITFYCREYLGNDDLHLVFDVQNDSDSMTDYFEAGRIRFSTDHPMFRMAKAAADKRVKREDEMRVRRMERCRAR